MASKRMGTGKKRSSVSSVVTTSHGDMRFANVNTLNNATAMYMQAVLIPRMLVKNLIILGARSFMPGSKAMPLRTYHKEVKVARRAAASTMPSSLLSPSADPKIK